MLPLVMMVLVVACLALVGHAVGAEQDQSSQLTRGLMIAVAPAVLSGLLSWGISRWQSLRDIQKIQEQLEAQYSAERRTRATQVSDALLFQAELLGTQLEAMKDMLADTEGNASLNLWNWFAEIKEEAARGAAKDAPSFSAKLHYHLIFAMTTLYYTSVYFRYAQEMYRLVPFTKLSQSQQTELKRKLSDVANAFARTGSERIEKEQGLWIPVQYNMGISVRKNGEHKSYSEFCRLFIGSTVEREDHIFLRPLDFYGANPAVRVDVAACTAITAALAELVKLRPQLFPRQ
jgi:hypothetical protein